MKEENVLWRRVVASKFGVDNRGWLANGRMQPHRRSLWKKIEE